MARKRTKNHYFRKEHQDAIVEYCSTQNPKRRNELYKEFIGPVFDEMVDKIVYTYKLLLSLILILSKTTVRTG